MLNKGKCQSHGYDKAEILTRETDMSTQKNKKLFYKYVSAYNFALISSVLRSQLEKTTNFIIKKITPTVDCEYCTPIEEGFI